MYRRGVCAALGRACTDPRHVPWSLLQVILFFFAVVGLWLAFNAWRPLDAERQRPIWVFALVTAELAIHHLVVHALVIGLTVAVGDVGSILGGATIVLSAMAAVLLGLVQRRAGRTRRVVADGIPGFDPQSIRLRDLVRPLPALPDGLERRAGIPYGPDPAQRLDLVVGSDSESAPILFVIPGGSWTSANRSVQARPLIHRMVASGWVAVVVGYRTSPEVAFPTHSGDIASALEWVRVNAADFGGDPERIVVTGGSAGGHLGLLSVLERANGVVGCMPFYPVTDLFGPDGGAKWPFLVTKVLQSRPQDDLDTWVGGSPVRREIGSHLPPMHFWHGTSDALVLPDESRRMVERLRTAGVETGYVEVPGATHGFDAIASVRTHWVTEGAHAILQRWARSSDRSGPAAQTA